MPISYWAAIIGPGDETRTRRVVGDDPIEAAGTFARSVIEDTEGEWHRGGIIVWEEHGRIESGLVFDIIASIVPCEDEGAEQGEVSCKVEVIGRY
ncbi:hypothetical protein BH11PSE6_BH11PSE6_12670 [soil metagenome]